MGDSRADDRIDLPPGFADHLAAVRSAVPRRSGDESACRDAGRWLGQLPGVEPYLNAPTEDVVDEAFQEAGLA